MSKTIIPLCNEAGEPLDTDEVMEFLQAVIEKGSPAQEDFRNFMTESLADLAKMGRSDWPVGFRMFLVNGMECLDGEVVDAYRVDFIAMPKLDHDGPATDADVEYVAEYMVVYQCGFAITETCQARNFIKVVKKSQIREISEVTRDLINRIANRNQ
jgi:hypothetical protein